MEHLSELRKRLIVSVVAFVICFIAAYVFRAQLIELLKQPLPANNRILVTLSPQEPFFATMKVVASGALLGAFPVLLYQVYAFVVPAVSDQPRRKVLMSVAAASMLFLAGVAFGFFVVLPVALQFLTGFDDGSFVNQNRAGEYFSFATGMLLASGALFEVPVAMLVLNRLNVFSVKKMREGRRIAIVAIAFIAAILPGGDPFSMLLLMLPQIILYEVGILIASALERRVLAPSVGEPV